jgi:integrase
VVVRHRAERLGNGHQPEDVCVRHGADVRKIKPYEATRHAAGSRLAHAGVSPDIIAAWLGHTDASFTMKTYVHARPEDLAAARDALARKIIRE